MPEVSKADHRANRLLAALEPDDFAWLEPHLEVVSLSRGTVLYETDETIRTAYFPHDSMVSLVTVLEEGGSVEMAVFGREAVVGFSSALVTRQSFGRFVVQLPGSASRMTIERLHEIVAARPAVRELLLRFTEALLRQTFQTVACNAVHSVEARCCRWILSTHDRIDQDTLPLTHEFLAEMLGVQRSTVSVVTRALQTAGLIIQRRGEFAVTDRAGLEEVTCECYGVIRETFSRLLPGTYERPRS
jgi:CRP-like cAMP-binding protein